MEIPAVKVYAGEPGGGLNWSFATGLGTGWLGGSFCGSGSGAGGIERPLDVTVRVSVSPGASGFPPRRRISWRIARYISPSESILGARTMYVRWLASSTTVFLMIRAFMGVGGFSGGNVGGGLNA